MSERCDALQPKVGLRVPLCFPCACSSMSAPELLKLPSPQRAASPCLCMCICEREKVREGDGQTARAEDKIALITLECG